MAGRGSAGRATGSISLDRGAEPRQRGPQFLVLHRGQGFGEFGHRCGVRRAASGAGLSRRDSGACRSASRPTALQPKKRLTRCRMTSEACWISSAIGPSTRSTSVAGSCGCPSTGRGHWIFSGSEWRGDLGARDLRPARHQFARGKALLGVGVGKHVAEQDGKRLCADRAGFCHGLPSIMPRAGGWFSDRGRFRAAAASDHSPSAGRERNLPTCRNSAPAGDRYRR